MATEEQKYDVIVIGSGPGGYSAAIRAAQRKLRVALLEKDRTGGTCLNRGCIPTKALLHDTVLISKLKELPYLKGNIEYVFQDVMRRKEEVVAKSVKGFEALLYNQGVELIKGDASLITPKRVRVNKSDGKEDTLAADHIVLAAGTTSYYASALEVDGLRILGTTEALNMAELPKRLAVIGSDYRGVEFATIFHCLGSDVILIEKERRILPGEDLEISSRLKQILADRMTVLTRAEVVKVEGKKGDMLLIVETSKGVQHVNVEKAIVMGERKAYVNGLGLERMGLSPQDGFFRVGPDMRTAVGSIYAVGDMIGAPFYAHKALADGVTAASSIAGDQPHGRRLIPRVVFTDPQIGAVGLTQREAEEKYGRDGLFIGKFPVEVSGRAMTLAEPKGSVKVVAEKKYGEILGVHIMGPQATELIALACVAMQNDLGIHELRESVFGHPTLSETLHEAILNIWGEAIHFYAEP
jgi:dihydrolipoamide dehydrogenase